MGFFTSPGANRGPIANELRYFRMYAEIKKSGGYVAYTEHAFAGMRLRAVVDDPVCSEAALVSLLRAFLADCDAASVAPIFPCVSAGVAAALRQVGFSTTMFGAEYAIPLKTFQLSKSQRKCLRGAPAQKLECRTVCQDLEELEQLNKAWLGDRPCTTEVQFVTFPPSMPKIGTVADEVRRLYAYQEGRLAGYIIAEPFYDDSASGKPVGYILNTTRFLPDVKPTWTPEFLAASLIEILQKEGNAEYLALGLTPFTELREEEGELGWLRQFFQEFWSSGEDSIYSVHGLAEKKRRLCAG